MKISSNETNLEADQNSGVLFKSLLCLVAIIYFYGVIAIYFGYGKPPIAQHHVPFYLVLFKDIFLLIGFCGIYSVAQKTLPPKKLILVICGLLVCVLISQPLDSVETYQHFLRNLLFYEVTFLFLIFSVSFTLKQISRIIFWFQNFTVIAGAFGVALIFLKLDHSFGGRSVSTFLTPHAAAGIFLLALIISIEAHLTASKICVNDYKVNILIVALICTGTFSVLLGFCFYGATLLFRMPVVEICKRLLFHSLFFLGYFLIGVFDNFVARLHYIFTPESRTISGRLAQLNEFSAFPAAAENMPREFQSYDSLYLFLISNMGVVGAVFFTALIVFKSQFLYQTFTLDVAKKTFLEHHVTLQNASRSLFIFTVVYFAVISHFTNAILSFPFNALYALVFACCIRYSCDAQIIRNQFHT